jgi:hypothetical protein
VKRFAVIAIAGMCTTASAAGAALLTPMAPGFHQHLQCDRGYVSVDVAAAGVSAEPGSVVVTTTLSLGTLATKTRALRVADARGNIYALGYVGADGAPKRFPKRLLLPATPLAAGERSGYFNVRGTLIEKRFEGMKSGGYEFSDYLSGRRLNSVTYVPGIGLTTARFFGMPPDGSDLACRSGHARF